MNETQRRQQERGLASIAELYSRAKANGTSYDDELFADYEIPNSTIVDRGVMIGLRMKGYDIAQSNVTELLNEIEKFEDHTVRSLMNSTLVEYAIRCLGSSGEYNGRHSRQQDPVEDYSHIEDDEDPLAAYWTINVEIL